MPVQNRFRRKAGARGIAGCGVFWPWSRTAEGPKSAVSGAIDGVANGAEAMPRSPVSQTLMANMEPGERIVSRQMIEIIITTLNSKTDFGHQ
jgi:hypothetical protein